MRVLFVTGEYPPMQGGVGDYTHEVGCALLGQGADVHVLTRPAVPATSDDGSQPAVHPWLVQSGWRLWGDVLGAVRALHPDVVHIQYQSAAYRLHPAINYLPWRMQRMDGGRTRRPLIFTTFHDIRVPYIMPKAGPLRFRAVLDLARYGDGSVVTNPADRAGLTKGDARLAPRLFPIPIGSNIHPELPAGYDRDAQRATWGAGPGDWLLAYFGFLNANKGGETLVRALKNLVAGGRPARLLMVGGQVGASDPTNFAYLEKVKGIIGELGLVERVGWTGFTDPAEVSANLCAADCAVLPYREGASLRHGSLMAALAHGLPIVTTREPVAHSDAAPGAPPGAAPIDADFPRLEDGISAMLVAPNDSTVLAAAVERVMASEHLRASLAAGSRCLSAAFGWDAIARQHLAMYAQVESI